MILCDKDCIPCCDFCIHVIQHVEEIDSKMVGLGPIGCKLHEDEEHQNIAKSCYYCEDYHCFNVKPTHAYIYGKRINNAKENTLSKEKLEEIKRDLANKISVDVVTKSAIEAAMRLAEDNE